MGHICGNENSTYYVHDDKTVWATSLMRTQLDPITLKTIETVQPEKAKEEKQEEESPAPPIGALNSAGPRIDPAVSAANMERYKNLKTPEGELAKKLCAGEGLNHSSFTRILNGGLAKDAMKRKSKEQYDAILKELIDNDLVKKQANDYFYKE